MNRHSILVISVLCSFVILLATISPVYAQGGSGTRIIVNYAEVQESSGEQTVDVYFTVVDVHNRVATNAQPQAARMTTSEGGFTAQVQRASAPLHIVLALDASGSMTNARAQDSMRQAAIAAVDNAPDEALISLVQFNDRITELVSFTADRNQVKNAIVSQVKPENNAGTCLYDTAMHTINLLDQHASETARRAVILFTDGRDEKLSDVPGQQYEPCSHNTFEAVSSRAQTVGEEVTIYTIGLEGNQALDAGALQNLAKATGGLSRVGDETDLSALFRDIMQALGNQWLARAPVCVSSDVTSVTLEVQLNGGQLLNPAARSVSFNTDCRSVTVTPTWAPLSVSVDSVQYVPEQNSVEFEIVRRGGGDIATYRIKIYNNQTGMLALEETVAAQHVQTQDVTLNLDNRIGDVEIVVTALDIAGTRLAQSDARRFAVPTPVPTSTPQPTRTPIPVAISLVSLEYDQNSDILVLSLDVQQQEDIRELEVFIDDASGINQIRQTPAIASRITLPLERRLEAGAEYRIRIRAVTDDGEVKEEATTFIYEPLITPTPTLTPTPSPTATLSPVRVTVVNMEYESARDVLTLTLDTHRPEDVLDFEIALVDADTQRVAGRFSPSLGEIVDIPMTGIPPLNTYIVRLSGRSVEGERLIAPEVEFYYEPDLEPSATPTPTLPPPQINVISTEYDDERDVMLLSLEVQQPDDILDFEVVLVDQHTQRVAGRFSPALAETIEIPMADIPPLRTYVVRINGRTAQGERLITPEVNFPYNPDLEPTPTPTPQPSIGLGAGSIKLNNGGDEFRIDISPTGEIADYEVQFVNDEGITVHEVRFASSPTDNLLRVPAGSLTSGKYRVLVSGTDASGMRIAPIEAEITYTRPPTPVPTAEPGAFTALGNKAKESPVLVLAIVLIAFVLMMLIIWAVRQARSGRQQDETTPLPDKTNVGERNAPGWSPAGGNHGGGAYDSTIIDEDDATIVDELETFAFLHVIDSPDPALANQRIDISKATFVIGRNSPNLDLNLRHDPRVSHRHATIKLQGDRFFVRDENSGNGLYLNGDRVPSHELTEIETGQHLRVGHTTMRFEYDGTTLVQ